MELHEEIAHGLEMLADLVHRHPELAEDLSTAFSRTLVPVGFRSNQRGRIAAFARAGKASGVTVRKDFDADWGGVTVAFGEYVGLYVYAHRDQVCERVVTGTEEVEEEIPDPDAPKVKRTVTKEIVEWQCPPLLAEEVA